MLCLGGMERSVFLIVIVLFYFWLQVKENQLQLVQTTKISKGIYWFMETKDWRNRMDTNACESYANRKTWPEIFKVFLSPPSSLLSSFKLAVSHSLFLFSFICLIQFFSPFQLLIPSVYLICNLSKRDLSVLVAGINLSGAGRILCKATSLVISQLMDGLSSWVRRSLFN